MPSKSLVAGILISMFCLSIWGADNPLADFDRFINNKALLNKAEIMESKGAYVKAAKLYRKLSKSNPEKQRSAAMLLKEAQCLLLAGKIHRSREAFTTLLTNYSLFVPYENVVESLRQLASNFELGQGTFLGIRDEHAAIAIYELIIREAPSIHVSLPDRLKLAELLLRNRRREEAANVFREILKKNPGLLEVRLQYADLLLNLSRRGDGDGRKRRAAARQLQSFLNDADKEHPQRPEAEAMLQKVHEAEAQYILSQAKFYLQKQQRRTETAKRYLREILEIYPNSQAAAEAKQLQLVEFCTNLEEINAKQKNETKTINNETIKLIKPKPNQKVKTNISERENVKKYTEPLEIIEEN